MFGVVLLSWAHFLNDGAANFLPGILPALLVALGIPIGYAGAIIAILVLGQGLQPFTGALADRWGWRGISAMGLVGSSLGAAWVGWAHSPASLIAALALIGVSNSVFHPPALTTVRRLSGGSGEGAMAVFLVGGEAGRGAWPLLASVVVVSMGLGGLWVLTLAAAVTVPLLWWQTQPLSRHPSTVSAWQGVRDAGRPLLMVITYSSLRAVLLFGLAAFIPLWWEARGGSLITGAALITAFLLVGIAGNLGSAVLARHFGRRRLVIAGTLAGVGLEAAFMLSSGAWLWITLSGVGIALFGTLPLTVLMGQDLLPRHPSLGGGLALGFCNALGALIVAPLGALAAVWGPVAVLWAVEACGVAALAFAFFLPVGARG
jgi:FSR family fosmidomycin resistance protein-like MFS transporter